MKIRQNHHIKMFVDYIQKYGIANTLFKLFLIVLFEITIYSHNYQNRIIQLILLITAIPVFIYVNYAVNYITNYIKKIENGNKKAIRQIILSLIVGLCIYISFIKKPYTLGKFIIIENIGYIIGITLVTFLLSDYIKKLKLNISLSKFKKIEILLLMIFPILVGTIAFLGVYPGAMSADSLYIWTLISKSTYNNMHPLLYMILIKGLSLIWNSPAVVSIFQIALTSFTYAYAVWRLNRVGLNKFLCYVMVIIATILPANLLINSVIWKDIPYTMFLILFSVEVLRIFTEKEYFKKVKNMIPIAIFGFCIMSMRHNGPYVMILFFVVLSVYLLLKKYYSNALKVLCIFVSGIILYVGLSNIVILYLGEKYEKNNNFTSIAFFSLPVQGLVNIYYDHYDELDSHDKERLFNYLNIDGVNSHIDKYSDPNWNVPYWRFQGSAKNTANSEAINDDKLGFFKTYYDFFKLYPKDIIASYMRSTAIAWSSAEYGFTSAFTLDIFKADSEYFKIINQKPVFDSVKNMMINIGSTAYKGITNMLFWRPALAMLGIMLLILASKDKFVILFIAAPAIINELSYFASCEGQCTRYIYINYTMLIFLTMFVLLRVKSIYSTEQIILKK